MPRDTHTTHDEKEYLNGLGSFYEGRSIEDRDETTGQRRVRLLQNYMASAKGRKVWNGVSPSEVIAHAEGLLRQAEGEVE